MITTRRKGLAALTLALGIACSDGESSKKKDGSEDGGDEGGTETGDLEVPVPMQLLEADTLARAGASPGASVCTPLTVDFGTTSGTAAAAAANLPVDLTSQARCVVDRATAILRAIAGPQGLLVGRVPKLAPGARVVYRLERADGPAQGLVVSRSTEMNRTFVLALFEAAEPAADALPSVAITLDEESGRVVIRQNASTASRNEVTYLAGGKAARFVAVYDDAGAGQIRAFALASSWDDAAGSRTDGVIAWRESPVSLARADLPRFHPANAASGDGLVFQLQYDGTSAFAQRIAAVRSDATRFDFGALDAAAATGAFEAQTLALDLDAMPPSEATAAARKAIENPQIFQVAGGVSTRAVPPEGAAAAAMREKLAQQGFPAGLTPLSALHIE